ncbi:MAG: hypothetical protein AB8B62_18910 [Roseobacter sp.]
MSDTDSFIDEVTEEVRRDRFYASLRRYGWIGALVVVLIVGGAAWTEYRKAQERATAEALGDQILGALASEEPEARQGQLETIGADTPGAEALLAFLAAAQATELGDTAEAATLLDAVAVNGDVPVMYRQIAAFKSLVLQAETMDPDTRRQQLEGMAVPGAPLSLLAQEQLALQDIAENNTDAAIDRFQVILQDAAVSADLQQRALQVIVALGGTPDLESVPGLGN